MKAVGDEIIIDPTAWLKLKSLYLITVGIDAVRIAAPGMVIKGRVIDVKNNRIGLSFKFPR